MGSLVWIPCAAHCIDLMLEDMGKNSFIKEVIDQRGASPSSYITIGLFLAS
jgi:hypothetical protein